MFTLKYTILQICAHTVVIGGNQPRFSDEVLAVCSLKVFGAFADRVVPRDRRTHASVQTRTPNTSIKIDINHFFTATPVDAT